MTMDQMVNWHGNHSVGLTTVSAKCAIAMILRDFEKISIWLVKHTRKQFSYTSTELDFCVISIVCRA